MKSKVRILILDWNLESETGIFSKYEMRSQVLCRECEGGAESKIFHVMRRHLEEKLQDSLTDEFRLPLQEELSILNGMHASQSGTKRNIQSQGLKRPRLTPTIAASTDLSNTARIVQRVRDRVFGTSGIPLDKEVKESDRTWGTSKGSWTMCRQ